MQRGEHIPYERRFVTVPTKTPAAAKCLAETQLATNQLATTQPVPNQPATRRKHRAAGPTSNRATRGGCNRRPQSTSITGGATKLDRLEVVDLTWPAEPIQRTAGENIPSKRARNWSIFRRKRAELNKPKFGPKTRPANARETAGQKRLLTGDWKLPRILIVGVMMSRQGFFGKFAAECDYNAGDRNA